VTAKLASYAVFGAIIALLAGCADSAVPSPQRGPTIVSLNPCSDAILADVSAPGQLRAISHYSHNPATSSMEAETAARFPSTGGTAEEVLALSPDIVVADSFLSPATRAAFEAAGLRVVALDMAYTLEDSLAQIADLALLTGQPQKGEQLAQSIQSAWDAARFEGDKAQALLWQSGGIVPGPDSLAADLLAHTGFDLQSAARGLGQGAYLPLEQVLADPPQIVLAAGDERMLDHPVLQQVEGLEYHQFDPGLLYCAGPTIIRAVDRLHSIRAGLE